MAGPQKVITLDMSEIPCFYLQFLHLHLSPFQLLIASLNHFTDCVLLLASERQFQRMLPRNDNELEPQVSVHVCGSLRRFCALKLYMISFFLKNSGIKVGFSLSNISCYSPCQHDVIKLLKLDACSQLFGMKCLYILPHDNEILK